MANDSPRISVHACCQEHLGRSHAPQIILPSSMLHCQHRRALQCDASFHYAVDVHCIPTGPLELDAPECFLDQLVQVGV